ncbi:MAG: carboxyl transferase domain-containing protein, partial [Candidatus Borkfalkiaceae bacterium]|nr:carboxyl transferase domain-containing protein [Clostridia bacterium]MDY6223069.1 carboxyl transferase domain-containing protein [Christensenellaceae bacterium]
GVTAMEGVAKVLMRATQLKGVVPQYVVVNGEVYGSLAALCAVADFTFFLKNSALAVNSPLVIAAKTGKTVKKEDVGTAKSLNKSGIPAFEAEGMEEVKATIAEITEIVSSPMLDAELNEPCPALNEKADAQTLAQIFENAVETGALCSPEVKTYLCRIGGIAAAAVVFDGGDEPVQLNADNLAKVKTFAEFAACYRLPLVVFSDVAGIAPCLCTHNSRALKEAAEYLNILDTIDAAKIAVVYKNAVGLGYSLFASKSAGFDYTCAFATAKIALFNDVQGAEIEFSGEKADKAVLAERYGNEKADPVNAAKDGYIDDVIEPQFVKQYLISALQMLIG